MAVYVTPTSMTYPTPYGDVVVRPLGEGRFDVGTAQSLQNQAETPKVWVNNVPYRFDLIVRTDEDGELVAERMTGDRTDQYGWDNMTASARKKLRAVALELAAKYRAECGDAIAAEEYEQAQADQRRQADKVLGLRRALADELERLRLIECRVVITDTEVPAELRETMETLLADGYEGPAEMLRDLAVLTLDFA